MKVTLTLTLTQLTVTGIDDYPQTLTQGLFVLKVILVDQTGSRDIANHVVVGLDLYYVTFPQAWRSDRFPEKLCGLNQAPIKTCFLISQWHHRSSQRVTTACLCHPVAQKPRSLVTGGLGLRMANRSLSRLLVTSERH
jgi:hypothetical protein